MVTAEPHLTMCPHASRNALTLPPHWIPRSPQHALAAATLVVDTLDREWRELTEKFPEPKDTSVSGGLEQRSKARAATKAMVLALREVALAIEEGRFDDAAAGLDRYRERLPLTVTAMEAAKDWSLFDRPLHD